MKIAGIDIGTTGCKCTIFNINGELIDKAYRDYPVKRIVESHEIDASLIMKGVYGCICELVSKYDDIEAIGVTSFGETFVCTDIQGNPVYSSMLYTDPRGKEECEELIAELGEMNIATITGLRPHEMYSISKIMWIKKNQPEVYQKTKRIFLMEDFVVFHLTGISQIDYSLASRTMAFDIQKLNWSEKVFSAAKIDLKLMSKPVATGTLAGVVKKEIAEKIGLNSSTKIITVSHDQVAAAVGAGAFNSDIAVDGAGTVQCITPIYDKIPNVKKMFEGYFSIVPYVIPEKYVAYAFSYTGGALMQWCTDNLAKKEKEIAIEQNISVNSYLENEYTSKHSGNPSNLLVLPHFAGAATPYMDTGSKGAIIGLTTDTSISDIYWGAMEGVVFEMYLNMKALNASGANFEKINATGGGANSREWMQMKADILNIPITSLKTVDAGTVGCAMITGVAIGIFENLEKAAEILVEEKETYFPREEIHNKYMNIYDRYEKIYSSIRSLV